MITTGHATMAPILKEDTVQHMECNMVMCKEQHKETNNERVAMVEITHAHTRSTRIGYTATHVDLT